MTRVLLVVLAIVGAPTPHKWVLRAHINQLSIYVDSSRVERHRPDTTTGFWLLWDNDTPQSMGPGSERYKQIEMHVGIRCSAPDVIRPYEVMVRDSAGRQMDDRKIGPADPVRSTFAAMAGNVAATMCRWLKDPTDPPTIDHELRST